MAFIALRQLLDHAAEHGYGVPAFNVNNMEQIQAIMQAAEATDSPVILQASAGARKYAGEPYLRHLVLAALEAHPDIPRRAASGSRREPGRLPAGDPLGLHVGDDGRLADAGPEDARRLRLQRRGEPPRGGRGACGGRVGRGRTRLSRLARNRRGGRGGRRRRRGPARRAKICSPIPTQARRFVEATGVDALAIAIGTSHGAYKFSRQPTGDILAIDRIVAIHERIPNTHLVMHGSSSVPQEWLAVIREYGGEIPETYGVPVEEIRRGIAHGVRKVNIDTDIRLAMTGAIRSVAGERHAPSSIRARALKAATAAARAICVERFEAFGCAGQAARIKPVPLDAMACRYH